MKKNNMLENTFKMPVLSVPKFVDRNFNIIEFGAVGNGVINNSEAINKAIEQCSLSGGGTVIVPRGIWLTGPIYLKSNVNLHTEEGALVTFTGNFDDYPLILSNYEGYNTARCTSPIMGWNLENIAITGRGIFDGNGEAWRPVKKFKLTEKQWDRLLKFGGVVEEAKDTIWWPTKNALKGKEYDRKMGGKCTNIEESKVYRDFFRPVLMSLVNCKNILIDGPIFQNSPAWCLHPRLCEQLTIRNITVRNPWFSQNGDGIDIESCKYVSLSNSTFDVGDDAICIKSGKNEEGRKLGRSTEYVSVMECTVYHGHGGFVIGSEMSGGVRNIKVSRCSFIGTDTGLRFKSCRGRGGVVENIFIEDINMMNIDKEAITFSTSYDIHKKPVEESSPEDIPEFRDFYIKDVTCIGAGTGIHISGLPEMPVSNVILENIHMKAKNDIKIENSRDISMENVDIKPLV